MKYAVTSLALCVLIFHEVNASEEKKELPTTEEVYNHIIARMHDKLTQPTPRRLQMSNAYVKNVILHQKSRHVDVILGDLDRKAESRNLCGCGNNDPSMTLGVDLSELQAEQLPQKNSQLTKEFQVFFRSNKNCFPATLSQQKLKS